MPPGTPSTPIYTILAACLSSARSEAWCQPQLIMLDRIIDTMADDLAQTYSRFDAYKFKHMARYGYDRLTVPRKDTDHS
jgi:hypothetical protein